MKIVLDITDDKADFVLELLRHFKFVKTLPLTPFQEEVLKDLKDSVEEINQVKAGQKKAQSLSEFLNEL